MENLQRYWHVTDQQIYLATWHSPCLCTCDVV